MVRELIISAEPIDEVQLMRLRKAENNAGAIVQFLGVVRGTEEGRSIRGLEYEAFQAMAEHQFQQLFDAVERRWTLLSIRLVHRIGFVAAGQTSLWVEIEAAHRGEAFAACQYLIDDMKRLVPIWKKPVLV